MVTIVGKGLFRIFSDG